MSLFNTLDFWSTKAGENETFGFHSLVVCKLDDSECDRIVIGSFDGVLRIYQVTFDESEQTSFRPSDLLIETQLSESICQVVVGKLFSGSKTTHIGIIHPRTISVYAFLALPGSTEHGSQFEIKLLYEHPLPRYNYQVVIGPFGAVRGRDFLCAVALDGTLSFFEQETFVYETQLPAFLLPAPITYVAETDTFVTLTRDWCIAAYRYQDLVSAKKKVTSTWWYNLGETLLDIQTRRYGQQETYLMALSEHNVTCFNANGLLKFTWRLQYTPICFYTYIHEQNNNLMMLIVSESGTVFIYEKCDLRWSAKLPIVPICILRANVGIDGALVLLSDQGDLHCCFLGTKPTLFVAPPLENSIAHFKNVGRKLESLQNQINTFKKNNRSSLALSMREQEVSVVLKFLPLDESLTCRMALELKANCPLSNVHVSFDISPPARVQPDSYIISSLYELVTYNPSIEISPNRDIVMARLDVTVVVCYMGPSGPRLIRQSAVIWPKFILHSYTATNADDEYSLRLHLSTNKATLSLQTLFPEFRDEQWVDGEMIGFSLRYNPNVKCVVSASKSSHGYTVAGNSTAMLHLMVTQLVQRCKKHDTRVSFEYREKVSRNELLEAVRGFVVARNEINKLEALLEKLCSQYRLIQRRLFIKVKEKVPSNLTSLRILYHNTHSKLMDTINLLDNRQLDFLKKVQNLQATIDLTFDLILMGKDCPKDMALRLRTAVNVPSQNSNFQDWGERTLANVTYLLRTSLSNSSRDEHRLVPPSDHVLSDPAELVNVIATALDRVLGVQSGGETTSLTNSTKNDQRGAVSPIPEVEENDDTHSPGTRLPPLMNRKKLLDKRPSVDY